MIPPLDIRSARLRLRPMTAADAPRFHGLVTHPEVAPMLFLFPTDWTLAEARAFLPLWAWTGELKFRLAIEESGEWRGWIGVSDGAEPEIFYALEPSAAGRGLAREAVAAFTAFLFEHFPVAALTAGVFHDNPASMKVLRACGFAESHVEMHQSLARAAPAPCHVFRLPRPQAGPSPRA